MKYTLEKEMSMTKAQLRKPKDAACEVELLEAKMPSLREILERKARTNFNIWSVYSRILPSDFIRFWNIVSTFTEVDQSFFLFLQLTPSILRVFFQGINMFFKEFDPYSQPCPLWLMRRVDVLFCRHWNAKIFQIDVSPKLLSWHHWKRRYTRDWVLHSITMLVHCYVMPRRACVDRYALLASSSQDLAWLFCATKIALHWIWKMKVRTTPICVSKLLVSTQLEGLRQSDQGLQLMLEMYEKESKDPRWVKWFFPQSCSDSGYILTLLTPSLCSHCNEVSSDMCFKNARVFVAWD